MNRLSITTRLILSFLTIIILTLVLFIVVTNRVVYNRFADLVERSGTNFSRRVVPILEQYYQANGSWDGVEDLVFDSSGNRDGGFGRFRQENGNMMTPGLMITAQDERFLLIDGDEIIFDTNPNGIAINNPENLTKFGTPVIVNGEQVGTFLVASVMGILSESQNIYLTRVNSTLIWVGAIAILLVLLVALWQSSSIVQPLREMANASRLLAKGDYNQRVQVQRNDELGDMATAFNQMAVDLSQQSELRRQMMADVAHELRTPLSVLRIDLESMEDGLMEASPENVRALQGEVSYLSNLVDDLRMLSLADAGDLKIEKSPVELNSLLREMVERQQNAARERNIIMTAHYDENEIFVMGDPQRLSQVMVNLLSNAIQHTLPDHEITTKIEVENQVARVTVTNYGTWIPKEDLERIFDRFYRLERSRNRDQGGSGLGLSIARSLINSHGGKIWAESEQGKSTTFNFTLPLLA
ncbi:MAG: HAMP domain-containing protein [Anaerolineaceae bacterium]|nr:HAMP domain-containing protein [Anaerolineaceae bacterium]